MFSTETIIELKKGNPQAFREVFRLLYPRLKGYTSLFVTNKSEAEDIIQESFVTLWEKRDSIEPDKSIESLIFVMVRNRCLNYLKSHHLNSKIIDLEDLPVSELQYLYQIDLKEKEEKSLEEMLIESFQEAVDALPGKMKTVFTLCKLEGKKQKEVADELDISIKMVEKHVAKAKLSIRKQLKKKYPSLIVLILLILG